MKEIKQALYNAVFVLLEQLKRAMMRRAFEATIFLFFLFTLTALKASALPGFTDILPTTDDKLVCRPWTSQILPGPGITGIPTGTVDIETTDSLKRDVSANAALKGLLGISFSVQNSILVVDDITNVQIFRPAFLDDCSLGSGAFIYSVAKAGSFKTHVTKVTGAPLPSPSPQTSAITAPSPIATGVSVLSSLASALTPSSATPRPASTNSPGNGGSIAICPSASMAGNLGSLIGSALQIFAQRLYSNASFNINLSNAHVNDNVEIGNEMYFAVQIVTLAQQSPGVRHKLRALGHFEHNAAELMDQNNHPSNWMVSARATSASSYTGDLAKVGARYCIDFTAFWKTDVNTTRSVTICPAPSEVVDPAISSAASIYFPVAAPSYFSVMDRPIGYHLDTTSSPPVLRSVRIRLNSGYHNKFEFTHVPGVVDPVLAKIDADVTLEEETYTVH